MPLENIRRFVHVEDAIRVQPHHFLLQSRHSCFSFDQVHPSTCAMQVDTFEAVAPHPAVYKAICGLKTSPWGGPLRKFSCLDRQGQPGTRHALAPHATHS